jgi:hypothetical protein
MRKQCLEFALPNPGEICKHMVGAYNSNSHARGLLLSYFCVQKQAEKPMQRRESFKEICHRKAQHYRSSLKEEKPLQFLIPLTQLPKNHNLFRTTPPWLARQQPQLSFIAEFTSDTHQAKRTWWLTPRANRQQHSQLIPPPPPRTGRRRAWLHRSGQF